MLNKIIAFFNHEDPHHRENIWIFATMLVGACLSLLASLVLSIEAFHLLENPNAQLSCSVNAVINCASVMQYDGANIFGWPNSFLGLMAEPVVITVAVAGLAGIKFPRVFMAAAQVGYGLGLLFALYLFSESLYVIGSLCPWCLLVTLTTTLVFFSLLRYNLRENNLYMSHTAHQKVLGWLKKDYDKLLVGVIIFIMAVLILLRFGSSLFA